MFALITPVMTSTDGPLCREHQVDPDGSRHLGDPADRLLDVARRDHHQVVQLVHDHQDERKARVLGAFRLGVRATSPRRRHVVAARRMELAVGDVGLPATVWSDPRRSCFVDRNVVGPSASSTVAVVAVASRVAIGHRRRRAAARRSCP